jgi:hypothetical protein
MTNDLTFGGFTPLLREFISSAMGDLRLATPETTSDQKRAALTASSFNELALALFQLQFQHNAPYRRLCEARGVTPAKVFAWHEVPATPTSAFKESELTSLTPEERTTVFLSSGTIQQRRSRHLHSAESLAIYEASLLPWFERHLLADVNELVDEQLPGPVDKLPFLALTPGPAIAPHSSLVHMFETARREFGSRDSLFAGRVDASGAWSLDMEATLFAIRKSMCANRPVVLLGTAFNFVHLLDYFAANNMRYHLARGSRVLETGGYKGQSREIPKKELHALITKHLGIAAEYIVSEYGMSELSSQAYDRIVGRPLTVPSALFHFPPWVRARIISPETGGEVENGGTGLIRVFDLANVRSVMAIQTEDLAVRRENAFELVGRVTHAEPRGCSLMSSNVETPGRRER